MNAPHVLIVDDNPMNVDLASFLLESAGFVVSVAADATQALDQLRAARPDLILMDVQLPGMDGLTLTRQLKADETTRGIAIVAFTAYAMRGDGAKMRAAGCDGYLSKPIEVERFADSVRALLPVR
jgi:CheY-like chemotaxis protein